MFCREQNPFAVIVCCSDSRVPPELLFDQTLGGLFVIRSAGNVIDSVAIGSVEFAVINFGTPLVMVLGHEDCGAVKAAIDGREMPGSISSIVEKIKPAVNRVIATGAKDDFFEVCIKENIRNAVEVLLKKSLIIRNLAESRELLVTGAKFYYQTGEVIFFRD